ncbi:MAG: hypothetical protein Kow009_11530 [Spirochaetales bacterium]
MTTLPFWRFRKSRNRTPAGVLPAVFLLMLVMLGGTLHADLVLWNQGRGVLYFLLLPVGVEGKTPLAENGEEAKTYLKQHREELEWVPPESFLKVRTDPSPYVLVGFYVTPEQPGFPLVRAMIPSVPGEPAFTIQEADIWKSAAGQRLMLYPWELELPKSPIQIDNRYLDWRKIEEVKHFPTSFAPPKVVKHRKGSAEAIPFDQAVTWPSKGTAVEGLKLLQGEKGIYLLISSYSPMESGTSYWFYLVPPSGSTGLVVELPILDRGGPILLWIPGQEKPVQIGTYVSDLFVLEGELLARYLPAAAEPLVQQVSKVWMSVSAPAADGTEEFYLTEIDVQDIPYESGTSP